MADPQTSDAQAVQNFIDWYIDPLKRTVDTDPAFGTFPLHIKHSDDFNWRIHFKAGGFAGTTAALQLTQLSSLQFLMLEKGRYDGVPMATGSATGQPDFDSTNQCYTMPVSLNGPALTAYLATLDATSTGFSTGGFNCAAASAKAAGNVSTQTTSGTTTNGGTQTVSTSTTPGTAQPTALTDYEFMAEFRWIQNGKQMRSVTFSIFVAREIIATAPAAVVIAPPPAPTDWRFLAAMSSEGTPFNGEGFGYFRAPLQLEVLGFQVALQQPDAAQGFRIQLTDTSGNELGAPAGSQFFGDMPANTAFANLLFGQVLPLNTGQEVRASIKNYAGSDAAGLVVNLICRQYLTNSPAGPSGPPAITSATATTLAAAAAATASLVGQVLTLGIPQGAQGLKGADGTNIATLQVTTLAPGAQATAQLTGTTLALGIPQGTAGTNGASVTGVQLTMLATGSQSTATLTNGTLLLRIAAPTNGTNGQNGTNGTNITAVQITMETAGQDATGTIQGTTLKLNIPYPAVQGSLTHAQNFGDVQYNSGQDLVAQLTFNGSARTALVMASFTNSDTSPTGQANYQVVLERVVGGNTSTVSTIAGTENHTGNGSTVPTMLMQVDANGSTPNGTAITFNLRVRGFGGGGARLQGTAQSICIAVTEL